MPSEGLHVGIYLMLSQALLFVHQYFGPFLALISVENDTLKVFTFIISSITF